LRETQESRGTATIRAVRSLALAVAGACALASAAEAQAVNAAVQADATAESSRTHNPVHFRKTVLFTPDYLARLAESASQRRSEEAAAAANPSTGDAATFARRYGISRDLAQKIYDIALAEGIDPDLGFRLVRVESRFNPRARSPAGALGLAQLMPSTARTLDRSLRTEAQILDPTTNLRLGFSYLRRHLDRYDGDVRLALLAYNRGYHNVDRALRAGRDPENGYSRKVLGTSGSTSAYRGPGITAR
jgi:soluble lytic murein transglycosylase-like protein